MRRVQSSGWRCDRLETLLERKVRLVGCTHAHEPGEFPPKDPCIQVQPQLEAIHSELQRCLLASWLLGGCQNSEVPPVLLVLMSFLVKTHLQLI